jgi:fibronectin type 3 domain-containing protein
VTTKKPTGVQDFAAITAGISQVDLVWKSNPLVEDIKYYNIYRRKGKEQYDLIAKSPINLYVDRGLDASTKYTYQISAVQLSGEGDRSDEKSAITANRPHKVTGLQAVTAVTEEGIQITLEWEPNSAEDNVKYYNVYRKKDGKEDLIARSPINSYVDRELDASTKYTYRVSAVQVSGLEGDP